MTRPDPNALGRAVTAAYRFDRSVRDDAEHLSAVLHDIEPSLRPDQVRAIVAAVLGDLGTTVATRAAEPDTTIATGFAAAHPDFDATVGVDLVRVFRERTGTAPAPPAPSPASSAPAPTTAPPAHPEPAPTTAPPAPAPTTAPPGYAGQAPTTAPPAAAHPSQAPTAKPPGPPTGLPSAVPVGAATQVHQTPAPGPAYQPTQPAPPGSQPQLPKRSRRGVWAGLVAVIVIAAVAVVLVLQGGDDTKKRAGAPSGTSKSGTTSASTGPSSPSTATPPKPFTSPVLWHFAQAYYKADQCYSLADHPEKVGPFPQELPDTELVVCSGPTASGEFWCKNNLQELKAERSHYIDVAAPGTLQKLSGKPAAFDSPTDVQYSYRRGGLRGLPGRVYWESSGLLCAAELQARQGVDVDGLVQFWRTGR